MHLLSVERERRSAYLGALFGGGGSWRSFIMYSGYIVSAPPSTVSSGIPDCEANSLTKGFLPGR
jgi:hypothetical protein